MAFLLLNSRVILVAKLIFVLIYYYIFYEILDVRSFSETYEKAFVISHMAILYSVFHFSAASERKAQRPPCLAIALICFSSVIILSFTFFTPFQSPVQLSFAILMLYSGVVIGVSGSTNFEDLYSGNSILKRSRLAAYAFRVVSTIIVTFCLVLVLIAIVG